VQFLWWTGWRKGEALGLQWRSVDFVSGTIRIEDMKSGDPRTLPFHALPELDALLRRLRERTEALERRRGKIVPYVFHRESGQPIRDLRRAWVAATRAAGVPGRILHDFRRTAVRRMERAGVPRSVAMKVSGHRTESIYRRYAIVAERDIADGLRKVAAFQRRVNSGTSRDNLESPVCLDPRKLLKELVAWDGIEPPTRGFSVRCSTS
jgi:integrase